MTISKEQTESLLAYVASAGSDELDCDGCFEFMAEFVEHEIAEREIPEALMIVQRHLEQCPCCNDEHEALLAGLHALAEAASSSAYARTQRTSRTPRVQALSGNTGSPRSRQTRVIPNNPRRRCAEGTRRMSL